MLESPGKCKGELGSIKTSLPEESSFYYMDVIRAFAASMVVLTHVRDLTLVDFSELKHSSLALKLLYFFAGFGHQAVMVFFVLSGFWITGSVNRRIEQKGFWSGYLIDRLSRLVIVLVPALALGGVLDWYGSHFLTSPIYSGLSGAHSLRVPVESRLTWDTLVANLLFLQTIIRPSFGSNGPLWSLAYEFWYYVWFPALLLLTRRRLSWALIALGVGLLSPVLTAGFLSWLAGTALYYAFEHVKRHGWIGQWKRGAAVMAAATLPLGASLVWGRIHESSLLIDIAVAASFALLLLGLCIAAPRRLRWLRGVAAYGANSSFSLYLFHFPIAAFIIASALPLGRTAPDSKGLLLMGGTFFIMILGGWLLSRLTERQTGLLRKRLRQLLLTRSRGFS
jgi:peptidoglycan/LPS O-acetylase OafA/YrhL